MRLVVFATVALAVAMTAEARAGEVTVSVTGVAEPHGRIGCALHGADDDFPMGRPSIPTQWVSPKNGRAECRFADVAPGAYAVAVAHDLNGNGKTDTNLFGLPTEQWGVSRGVRPSLRAPRFAEAAFEVAGASVEIAVEVAK